MINNVLDKLIQDKITKGIEKFKDNYETVKESLEKYIKLYSQEKKKVIELTKIQNQLNEFKTFQNLINEGNFEDISTYLGLKEIKINFNGMDSEKIPTWFRLLCTYYKDKDKLFTLMDMFNIDYPYWAKSFKMPFDYGEDELDLIFDQMGKMYVCNGEIFSNNMGFYWSYHSRYNGNLKDLFHRESYVEIPWNLFLQNPLLTTEKYFELIIEVLRKKYSNSDYFFMIQNYQELSKDQVNRMAEFLPTKNFYSYHNFFLEKNKGIFKQREDLAKLFKHKMTDYERSPFYYLNYPLEMQKEFVLRNSDNHSGYGIELVKKMSVSNEEKLKLINKIATKLLDKTK